MLAFTLTGCGLLTPKTEYNTKVITPDDNLIMDCDISEPPSKADYAAATQKEREVILTKYVNTVLNDEIVCNKRLSRLRDWKKQVMKIDKPITAVQPKTDTSLSGN